MLNEKRGDKYKVLSLFSGCGGLDLGFAQLGADSLDLQKLSTDKRKVRGTKFEIVWANDIYVPSCQTYSANFNAEIYTNSEEPYTGRHRIFRGDIAEISFEDAVDKEKISVVLGGFPCQDFSIIRGSDKRLGIKVKRGRLYCHFVRALAWLQPKMFVAENVKGLKSANKGLAYKRILNDFENLKIRWHEIEIEYENHSFKREALNSRKLEGYHILFSRVVKFANFGVPQARERLVIIGLRKDLYKKLGTSGVVVEDLVESLSGTKLKFANQPLTPIEALNGKTLESLQDLYKKVMMEFAKNIENIDSKRALTFKKQVWPDYMMDIWRDYFWLNKNNAEKQHLTAFMRDQHKRVLLELGYYENPLDTAGEFEDKSNAILNEANQVKKRMKNIPPGENHEFVRNTKHHVTGLMSNIYKRIHPLKPSPTVIAKGGGGTWGYHYAENRQRLTNRERARLQTFPDSFVFKGKPGQVRTQLGEAVPPLAAKAIAESVFEILDKVSKT